MIKLQEDSECFYTTLLRISMFMIGFSVGAFITAKSFIQYEKPTEWRDGGVIIHKTQAFYLKEIK